jgi:hypothetical protein
MYACFWQIPAIWKRQLHTLSSHFDVQREGLKTTHECRSYKLLSGLKLSVMQSDYMVHMGQTEYTAPVYHLKCFPGGFKQWHPIHN